MLFRSDQGHKIEIYKKIASIRNVDDMYKIEEEIKERFGSIPSNTQNLLLISYIKSVARAFKITSVTQNGKNIRIQFKDDSRINAEKIGDILYKYNREVTFNATAEPYFIYRVDTADQHEMLEKLLPLLFYPLLSYLNILLIMMLTLLLQVLTLIIFLISF